MFRQEATHRTPRVAALTLLAALTACALAFAVGSALAAGAPDTSITAGPSGTYRSGSAQFSLSSATGGATFECSLDGGAFEPCSSQPTFEVSNGSHRLEARAVAPGTGGAPDATPAVRTWWADASFQNGNFETAPGGWTSQGFTVPGFGSSAGTLQVVDGGLAGGKKMGRFTASGSGSPTISTSPDPFDAISAGVTLTARGSVRGMTSGRSLCLRLREYQKGDAGDTLVSSAQTCVTTNGSWQAFPALTYTTQQNGSYVDALVYQTSTAPAGEIFYVDGLSVSEPGSPSVPALPAVQGDPVLLGLADIASCWSAGDEATARLLDTTPGVIGIAGDTEQNHGEPAEFQGCYEPTWGRHKWRTKPAVGDHEYGTPGAAGYFGYFGAAAAENGKGWYSYDLGSWHMVVLNSNCDLVGGCGPGSEQYEWLQDDLAANAGSCVGAYWHHPRWSAGATHGSLTKSAPFWDVLYEYGAEFVYSGNDHTYQRFAPQTPSGEVDQARGLRQFVVGSGGTQHYPLSAPLPNTQVQTTGTFGALKLTLHPNSYEWRFLPQDGRTFTDTGTTDCSPLTTDTQSPETTIDSGPEGVVPSTLASISFSSSESGSTFECKLDGGAWQACSSPRALSGLAQGSHTFRVRAIDPAGNVDPTEATRTWTVDTAAPDTTIGTGPSEPTSSTAASFSFGATETGSTFECKVDGGAWQACTPPRALSGLGQGAHTFSVRATDQAGNVDPTEAVRTWTVDTQAPDTSLTGGPSGVAASTSASFPFTSTETGSTFECKLDSGAWQACSSPRGLTALAQGAHTFRVRAIDAAGNADPTEATRDWTVDTVAPDTSISSGPSGTVASTTAAIEFGSADPDAGFECKLDEGPWADCDSPRTLTGLSQGTHTFRARAVDPAGNADLSEATRTWTVDTVAPDTAITSGPSGPTASTSASLAFTATETGSTFECKLDDGAWAACTSPRALTALAQGAHTFRVRATDAAGNTDSSEAIRNWAVDTVAPETTIASGPSETVSSTGATITFAADDGQATFQCKLDDGAWQACTSPRSLTGLSQGSHTFRVRATDAAGNVDATEATRTWTVDTVAPSTSIGSAPSGLTSTSSAAFGFSSSETGSTFECRVDGGAWQGCTSPHGLTGVSDGDHAFAVRATDAAGNTDPTEATRAWIVDTGAPDTSIGSGPAGPTTSTAATFAFTATETGSTFQCKLDDGAWATCTSPRSLTGLAQGAHTFRVRSIDPAGNVDASEATRAWSVDTAAPETSITAGPTGPTASKTASFSFSSPDPEAGFQCKLDDGAWQACTSPRAMENLSEGAHSFRVRAVDPAGNVDLTEAARSWNVDTQAPETTLGGGPSGHVATGAASFPFSSSEAGSSFECKLDDGPWQACSSPRSLTGLGDGEHTLRVRAIDPAGNVDPTEATRTWTVDTAAPDTGISAGPSGPMSSTAASFGFSSGETGSTYECRLDDGAWQTCASPRSLTGLGQGQHSFRVRATDLAGNVDATEAIRTWTVDTEAPDTEIEAGPEGTVSSNRADFDLTSAEAGSTLECKLDDGAWQSCGSPHALTGLANGEHTFRARATDAAGNTDPSPATRTWVIDAEPPDTAITAGPSGTTQATGATFRFTASEPSATFECRVDEGAWAPCGSPRTLAGLGYGRHSFHVRALDSLGNSDATEAIRTWTIERAPRKPTPPPAITPPQPPVAPAAPSQNLIAAQLRRDLATAARALRKLGARKLRARRGFSTPALQALTSGAFSAKLTARGAGGAAVLGKGSRSAGTAGRQPLKLKLTRIGLRRLSEGGRLQLRLSLEFRDSTGRRTLKVASLRL